MNERIKELEDQASQYASRETTNLDEWEFIFRKKFAELIVRECAQVCLSQRDPANLNYKPSERFAEAVKQHFGV
jgi:hypothetical protein